MVLFDKKHTPLTIFKWFILPIFSYIRCFWLREYSSCRFLTLITHFYFWALGLTHVFIIIIHYYYYYYYFKGTLTAVVCL